MINLFIHIQTDDGNMMMIIIKCNVKQDSKQFWYIVIKFIDDLHTQLSIDQFDSDVSSHLMNVSYALTGILFSTFFELEGEIRYNNSDALFRSKTVFETFVNILIIQASHVQDTLFFVSVEFAYDKISKKQLLKIFLTISDKTIK